MKALSTLTLIAALLLIQPLRADTDMWKDRSPHKESFVTVNGVKLYTLDWGGKGDALLLLNGWGDSAHCFDDLAPRFTDKFHVLAFTRRGYGESDRPAHGYDPVTLTGEVIGFMDAKGIKRAILAGHSAAGDIITLAATRYPERIIKLVYFDALYIYNRSRDPQINKDAAALLPTEKPSTKVSNLDELRRDMKDWMITGITPHHFWSDALENEIHGLVRKNPDGTTDVRTSLGTDPMWNEFFEGVQKTPRDYKGIKAPALAFWTYRDDANAYSSLTPEQRWKVDLFDLRWNKPMYLACRDKFLAEIPHGKVVPLYYTNHYCFVDRIEDVVREMRMFLIGN